VIDRLGGGGIGPIAGPALPIIAHRRFEQPPIVERREAAAHARLLLARGDDQQVAERVDGCCCRAEWMPSSLQIRISGRVIGSFRLK